MPVLYHRCVDFISRPPDGHSGRLASVSLSAKRSFGLRRVAIKRLRLRQKVRGRRIANTEEAPEEHLPGLLPHEYEAWARRDPSHRKTTIQEDGCKVAARCAEPQPGCPLLAHSGRATRADEGLLLGAKRTWTNRC